MLTYDKPETKFELINRNQIFCLFFSSTKIIVKWGNHFLTILSSLKFLEPFSKLMQIQFLGIAIGSLQPNVHGTYKLQQQIDDQAWTDALMAGQTLLYVPRDVLNTSPECVCQLRAALPESIEEGRIDGWGRGGGINHVLRTGEFQDALDKHGQTTPSL